MAFNTTGNNIYIVETASPFERIAFQFMPENVQKQRSAKIATIDVVGRNNSRYQFTGGEDKLSFTLDFFSDEESREDVKRKVNFLESLAMNDGGVGPARNVKIVMGKLFRNEVWIVSSVDTSYSNFDNRFSYLPIRAQVKINLILDPSKNRRIKDVRG